MEKRAELGRCVCVYIRMSAHPQSFVSVGAQSTGLPAFPAGVCLQEQRGACILLGKFLIESRSVGASVYIGRSIDSGNVLLSLMNC